MISSELPKQTPIRVMLIDDDQDDMVIVRDLLADISGTTYQLDWTSDYENGLDCICQGQHDVYLLDFRLGEHNGLELLQQARERNCPGPIILLTGQNGLELDRAAMQAGAFDFLEKANLDARLLERSIRYAVVQRRAERELEEKVRQRTAELARLNETLRETDRRKDAFLATLAHELRNPLAPIRNALEIIRLAEYNPATIEKSRGILERQVGQLVRLIDDLLDVSRITRGKLRLECKPVRLADLFAAAQESSQPHIDKAGLTLEVTLPEPGLLLTVDRLRFAQVLSNLLNNAAKYTEVGGKVFLSAAQEDSLIHIRVRDTGVGIPPDMLPYLFDLFNQVDRSLNRSQGGLGIGLALVKMLVEMHQGRVTAHSAGVGQGAAFTIVLPLVPDLPV